MSITIEQFVSKTPRISERKKLEFKLKVIDNLLSELAETGEPPYPLPAGKTAEDCIKELQAERGEVQEKMKQYPPGIKQKGGGEVQKVKLGDLIKTMLADIPCQPIEKETIYLEPKEVKILKDDTVTLSTTESANQNMISFVGSIEDPNNDPLNRDQENGGFSLWWVYELPARLFDTRYDISIYGGINAVMTAVSNNVFGKRSWGGFIVGILSLEDDEEYYFDEGAPYPIPVRKDWMGPMRSENDAHDQSGVHFSRTLTLKAGDTKLAGLGFHFWLCANCCKIEANGQARAHQDISNSTLPLL
ncbi:MAG: hypothetical protein WBB64_02180, partial [Anaerolineales bacterium]